MYLSDIDEQSIEMKRIWNVTSQNHLQDLKDYKVNIQNIQTNNKIIYIPAICRWAGNNDVRQERSRIYEQENQGGVWEDMIWRKLDTMYIGGKGEDLNIGNEKISVCYNYCLGGKIESNGPKEKEIKSEISTGKKISK